jgi:hypothetical protein
LKINWVDVAVNDYQSALNDRVCDVYVNLPRSLMDNLLVELARFSRLLAIELKARARADK